MYRSSKITWRDQNSNKMVCIGAGKGARTGLDRYLNGCVYIPSPRAILHLGTIYSYSDNVNSKDSTGAKSSIHVTAYS